MSCELRRDDDLLLQSGFLLTFKWIIDIFVWKHKLKFLRHWLFELVWGHIIGQLVDVSIYQIGPHSKIVISVYLSGLPTLLLYHFDWTIFILVKIVFEAWWVCIYISEQFWFDWNIWQPILKLILWKKLICLQFFTLLLNLAYEQWIPIISW